MWPSPYTPGEAPRTSPGPARQVAGVDERLSTLIDLGRIRVDHAARGFGKTSLLREYQRRAAARGAVTVWVTVGEEQGLVVQIAAEVQRGMDGFGDDAGGASRQDRVVAGLRRGTWLCDRDWYVPSSDRQPGRPVRVRLRP